MDDPSIFLIIGALVLFVFVVPIVSLIRTSGLKKKANALNAELEALRGELRNIHQRLVSIEKQSTHEDLRQVIQRVFALEQRVKEGAAPSTHAVATAPKASERVPEVSAPAVPQAPVIVTPVVQPPVAAAPVTPVVAKPVEPQTPAPDGPEIAKPAAPPQPPAPAAPAKPLEPAFARSRIGAPLSESEGTEKSRGWADLEEKLGTSWLNKIGTAAFVIGVALLLNYSMHYLGAAGKIALGFGLSAALLAIGIVGEKKERYRIVSRAVLGGGWALAYFTTYALHNIASVRLVSSPELGFALLFVVAVAMVAHSLRYHSEVTTGFAYMLAFATVAVSQIPFGALIASALLAASLAVILRQRRWYAIEPFAIAANYFVHYMWISQIYAAMGARKLFPEFRESIALLTTYWLIYVISYFLRSEAEPENARLLATSFLVNAAGYLLLLHYQAFHPEWRFWFLLGAGGVYLGLSGYARHISRRWGYLLASTLGVTLMVAAAPYRYSGRGLEIFWLIESQALLLVGWRAPDAHLRRLGWVAVNVLSCYMIFHDLADRFTQWAPPNSGLGWMLLLLAAALFVDSLLKSRLKEDTGFELQLAQVASVLGCGFLVAAAWVALPYFWTAVAWAATGVALLHVGRRFRDWELTICAHGAAMLAFVRILAINLERSDKWHSASLRLITVAASIAFFYLAGASYDAGPSEGKAEHALVADTLSRALKFIGGLRGAYTGAATLLMSLLIWQEVTTAAIGLAWGMFGLALLGIGDALRDRRLRVQAQALFVASFAEIFLGDLDSAATIGRFPARVLTVSFLAAIYYFSAYAIDEWPIVRKTLIWFGTIALAALLRFQLHDPWVAVGWAAMTVALFAIGNRQTRQIFRNQSFVLAVLTGVRCAFDNFYRVSVWHFTNMRTITVGIAAALLYVLFGITQFSKGRPVEAGSDEAPPSARSKIRRVWTYIKANPRYLFFFVPTLLVTVLVSLEVRTSYLTAAWGVEALIVFLAVYKMDERAYRWFSLILFLMCVGRVVVFDVWTLDALGRIVSFMGLGAALLAVSFLYARHREVLRRML